ncbi:uncharacterized protein MELLADRAFT_69956 [Melampsora larici-populina 98AG31]|uniref:Uncharacterized protein n=1 Tax=Melampsora larici-populina (strain 98AG31 / pathotype 3-4-7) TaxID=747676 RepID=F4SCX6_MELLP|nr:uncharacterized protein MELLADRAFT_69956 [Melampsora larici-populina 98AG31]EGF97496.1 hypothetical protein MELLADRAFT_69956 [Melampsora larici-populina 98AG31]
MTSNHSQSSHGFFTVDQPNFPPPLLYPQFAEPTIYLPTSEPPIRSNLSTISNFNHHQEFNESSQNHPSSLLLNSLSTLGKDGDVKSVRKELCIVFEEVEDLIHETDVVFSSILKNLLTRFEKLINEISLSGFGGLPIDSLYNLHTLLDSKEREVQELYVERQKRRDGSNIVMGILQSSNNSNGNTNPPAVLVTGDSGVAQRSRTKLTSDKSQAYIRV